MSRRLAFLVAALAYLAAAVVLTWPLAASLTTHLPGDPTGDTGVYAWNLWLFAHAVGSEKGAFFTDAVFPLTGGVDLSLHNYTVASGVFALPLIGWLGTVGAFNVVFLIQLTLAALGVYALAREVTGGAVASWVAGLLFAFSPVLAAKATGHFSLVAAAPLSFFALAALRALRGPRLFVPSVAAGLCFAWASYSDLYYGVYCMLLLAVLVAYDMWMMAPASERRPLRTSEWALVLVAVTAVTAGMAIRGTGGRDYVMFGVIVHGRTAYTPMLVATACGLWLLTQRLLPRLRIDPGFRVHRVCVSLATSLVVAIVLLSPLLLAMVQRVLDGRWVSGPQYWRSTTPGLDILALVLPNPSHVIWGGQSRALLESWRPGSYPEYVGSLPLVALLTVLWGRVRRGAWQQGVGVWLALFATAVLLSLGPFVTIAGLNTQIPGPWSVLRYAPVLGWARAPSRFAVLSTLALCMLFAFALRDLLRQPRARAFVVAPLLLVLALEHASFPRLLYAAATPDIYDVVASDPDTNVRVLELPVGVRDGLRSIGNARPVAQFYQTHHGKAVVGGYLSRVSDRRRRDNMRIPTLRALLELSQGNVLEREIDLSGRVMARRFVQRGRVGYVVINRRRASEELRQWAIDALELTFVAESAGRELYRPAAWPPEVPLPPGRRLFTEP